MVTTPGDNTDLDRSDRDDLLKAAVIILLIVLAGAMIFTLGRATNTANNKATSEISQKLTLAQQVAAACALKVRADDLGGLCTTAKAIVAQGPAGVPGLSGADGVTGPAGPLGPKGLPGSTGPKGAQGIFGPTGQKGITGVTGAVGAPGTDGSVGPEGPVSTTPGPAGTNGADGKPGTDGAPGANGTNGQTPTDMTCIQDTVAKDTYDCTVTAWK